MTATLTSVKPLGLAHFKSMDRFTSLARKRPAVNASSGRILQVFLNVDMRFGHDGLDDFARRHSVDVAALAPGQYVVFVNTSKDRIKVYASNGVVAYKRLAKGQIFDMRVIQEIPRAFNAQGTLDMDKAIGDALKSALKRVSDRVKSSKALQTSL